MTREQCFAQLLQGKAIESDGWLEKIRLDALKSAEALNFPSERQDDWRFTDLSSMFQHGFQTVATYASVKLADIEKLFIHDTIRLVFVDGCHNAELSDLSQAGQGVTVCSLVERFDDPQVEGHFARHAPFDQDGFAALNTRFFEDGSYVHVSAEIITPIHILHIVTRRDAPSAIYPRCLVVMDANSRATIIEDYAGLNDGIYFSNAVTEVVLKNHAHLQHVRVQREEKSAFHVGQSSVELGQGSVYTAVSLAFGARLSRHNLHVTQRGEGAEIHLDGLALIAGRQIADTHTLIDHAAPKGKSVQLHKCIADDAAHAIFGGKIVVHVGAIGTDSTQSSRNLLLSGKAHIDTQPQLEIFNDDVSCKHGATVGQIDADALFFLRSRGLTDESARNLLTYAFAAEIIAKIPVPFLAETLSRAILERMTGAAQ